MNESPPPILYKYCPLKRVDALNTGRLRFSLATSFNDPFELLPNVLHNGDLNHEKILHKLKQDIVQKHFILCLCQNENAASMWGNYAEDYKGFAIGFKSGASFLKKRNVVLRKVEYSTRRPWYFFEKKKKSHALIRKAIKDTAVWTKSIEWEHEKEWRAIIKRNGGGWTKEGFRDVSYEPKDIVEIRIGCRMPTYVMFDVLKILKTKPFRHVKIILQLVSNTHYGFDSLPVSRRNFELYIHQSRVYELFRMNRTHRAIFCCVSDKAVPAKIASANYLLKRAIKIVTRSAKEYWLRDVDWCQVTLISKGEVAMATIIGIADFENSPKDQPNLGWVNNMRVDDSFREMFIPLESKIAPK